MNFEKYDKFLLRIIGTLILISLIAGLAGVTITFFFTPGAGKKSDVVSADQLNKKNIPFSFHQASALEKTDYVMVEVTNREVEVSSFKSYHPNSTNILLINHRNGERFWILEHSDSTVRATRVYESDHKEKKVLGLFLEISDSSSEETKSLKYYDLSTKRLIPVALGVHKYINSVWLQSNDMLVFFTKNSSAYYTRLNLETFEVLELQLNSPPI